MIALIGDYTPVRGDGERICEMAFDYVIKRNKERLNVSRYSAVTFLNDGRVLTITTDKPIHAGASVVASLTAMHVWDLEPLDALEKRVTSWIETPR